MGLQSSMKFAFFVSLLSPGISAFSFVGRDEWGARSSGSQTMTNFVGKVIIHHTVTPECNTTCDKSIRSIQSYHMDTNKWFDIGYNFLIGGDGNVYEGRGWNVVGAHTKGYNSVSYGIAFIGNFTSVNPNYQAQLAAHQLLASAVKLRKLVCDYKIYGARDVRPTFSPGDSLYDLIRTWSNY